MHAHQPQSIDKIEVFDEDFGAKDDWILADESKDEGLVKIFAQAIENEIATNIAAGSHQSPTTSFHGHKAPSITVVAYIERIAKLTNCSPCCFVLAWRYLKQIQAKNAKLYCLNELNIHRLVLTTVMVAAKFIDDLYYSNQYWAKVGGVPNDELNSLEIEMLFLLSFNLHVRKMEYHALLTDMMECQKQGSSNDMLAIVDGVKLIHTSG